MMNSNLPPGVSESMIPGNRPEDEEWEAVHELLDSEAEVHRLDAHDMRGVLSWGVWIYLRILEKERKRTHGVIELCFDPGESCWIARYGVYCAMGLYPRDALEALSRNPNVEFPLSPCRPIKSSEVTDD